MTDHAISDSRTAAVMAALKPLLQPDDVDCMDDGGSIGPAVKDLGLEHHQVVTSSGSRATGVW